MQKFNIVLSSPDFIRTLELKRRNIKGVNADNAAEEIAHLYKQKLENKLNKDYASNRSITSTTECNPSKIFIIENKKKKERYAYIVKITVSDDKNYRKLHVDTNISSIIIFQNNDIIKLQAIEIVRKYVFEEDMFLHTCEKGSAPDKPTYVDKASGVTANNTWIIKDAIHEIVKDPIKLSVCRKGEEDNVREVLMYSFKLENVGIRGRNLDYKDGKLKKPLNNKYMEFRLSVEDVYNGGLLQAAINGIKCKFVKV